MMFIVMMYSTAIPCLYLAGFFICFFMYWSDKALFLRHYRSPPRYGLELATRAHKIMTWSILLHLMCGLYMISNPDIFSYEQSNLPWVKWAFGYT